MPDALRREPTLRLYELTDARTGLWRPFLRVWMHGLDPAAPPPAPDDPSASGTLASAARVFAALRRGGVRWVLADASVGGVNCALDPWDLVVVYDFFDDMRHLPRMAFQGNLSMRQPFCRALRRALFAAAGRHLGPYAALAQRVEGRPVCPKVVPRGVYVNPEGRWLETFTQVADYQCRGFDVVGMTLVPEARLARAMGAHFGALTLVVNPAEGVVDPDSGALFAWSKADLHRIYDHCGPVIAAIVLEAMAQVDEHAPGCLCDAVAAAGPSGAAKYGQYVEG